MKFRMLFSPKTVAIGILDKSSYIWPSKMYIVVRYYLEHGVVLNLKNPKTFDEKLNWLKIYYQKPLLTTLADKYEVKKVVSEIIGEEYVVKCYGVFNNFDEIDFSTLPDSFVLKTTHDSSGATIVKNKFKLNKNAISNKLSKLQKKNHYYKYREWPYKNIQPRIIIDHYLDDKSGHELRDYKFWCFNGEPKIMYCTNKGVDIFENFYDMNFNPVNLSHGFKRNVPEFEKPKEFDLMIKLATRLSCGFPFVRVDFFDVNGHVYFGEYTFYDWGGFLPINEPEWEMKLGSWIKLPPPQKKNNK